MISAAEEPTARRPIEHFTCYQSHEEAGLIWHYTGAGFENILKTKSVWLSDTRALNDTEELAWIDQAVKASALAAARWPVRGADPGRTHERWAASQWRDYSGEGGAALGFDRSVLEQLADGRRVQLTDCIYGVTASDFEAEFRALFGRGSTLLSAASQGHKPDLVHAFLAAAKLKHVGFRPEAEVRAGHMRALPGGEQLPSGTHSSYGQTVQHMSFLWRVEGTCAPRKIVTGAT